MMKRFITDPISPATKNRSVLFFLLMLSLYSSTICNAQVSELELQKKNMAVDPVSDSSKEVTEVVPVVISADLIKKNNDTLTFKITNPELKNTLFNSQEKRDALFAMPGIIEISLFGDEPSFTVKMLGFYAEKYLTAHFDICRDNSPELFEMLKR